MTAVSPSSSSFSSSPPPLSAQGVLLEEGRGGLSKQGRLRMPQGGEDEHAHDDSSLSRLDEPIPETIVSLLLCPLPASLPLSRSTSIYSYIYLSIAILLCLAIFLAVSLSICLTLSSYPPCCISPGPVVRCLSVSICFVWLKKTSFFSFFSFLVCRRET